MGKVTALSRFIPRSAETAQPIFGVLKKGKFAWTRECEEAFQKLKMILAVPPILTRPVPDIPLCLYFSTSENVISIVLVQEREGEQRPVYFVSKVLQGPETRYPKIDKAALPLVTASRRLRPYFQNFGIIVRTNLPIRQVLGKPDLAGQMVAWSIQLSEFDIVFESRGHVKAQAIADFLVELAPEGRREEEGEWYLSVDGSSNHIGSGAGIILEGPTGVLIEQSLHFEFKASNNQAEYEALLVGMKLAQELGTKKLMAKSDSKLVTRQINGEYQAKDPQLAKYRDRAAAMASSFDSFILLHVPRDQNERADLLEKLANNPGEALKITKEAAKYTLPGQHLYRRGFSFPLLRCLEDEELAYVIKEVHEGVCDTHIGGRALASKIARAGYYWPTLRRDCLEYVKKCNKCQKFAEGHKAPPEHYFTKWIEAELVASITTERIKRFYWKKIICRFGILAEIVSDNGTQFASKGTVEFCIEETKGRWAEELPQVLWSYHTTPHSTTNETPFRLTFGTEAIIPIEIGEPSPRTALFEPSGNEEELRTNLDLLQEVREIAHGSKKVQLEGHPKELQNRGSSPKKDYSGRRQKQTNTILGRSFQSNRGSGTRSILFRKPRKEEVAPNMECRLPTHLLQLNE
ncbi:Retrovirus-related Pol polyprotein, partial [Mucuna pruriens]